jgi:hypothetical protein
MGSLYREIIEYDAQGFYDQFYLELALESMMFVWTWKGDKQVHFDPQNPDPG